MSVKTRAFLNGWINVSMSWRKISNLKARQRLNHSKAITVCISAIWSEFMSNFIRSKLYWLQQNSSAGNRPAAIQIDSHISAWSPVQIFEHHITYLHSSLLLPKVDIRFWSTFLSIQPDSYTRSTSSLPTKVFLLIFRSFRRF